MNYLNQINRDEKENHFKKLLSKIIALSSWITYLIGLGFFYHATDLVTLYKLVLTTSK